MTHGRRAATLQEAIDPMERPEMTSGAPPRLPTGGEVVGWLVSALRFADLRAGTEAFSESTAKRVARAAAEVSDEKRSEVLRALVHRFFSDDYLASHGLNRDAAQQHNMVVLAGLEGALSKWDALVGMGNGMGREYAEAVVIHGAPEVLLDAALRIGAYLACFRKVIPASRFVWEWCSKPGIQGAFHTLLKRSTVPPSDNVLIRSAKIARNTLRDIKSGKSIPQEETILRLASAFSKHGVQNGDGTETDECGLELELRLSCLVGAIRALVASYLKHPVMMGIGFSPKNIAFFASDLRRYDPSELATIVAQGVRCPRWTEIHARLSKGLLEPEMIAMARRIEAKVDSVYEKATQLLSTGDERAAHELIANDFRDQARMLQESMGHIPGWEKGTPGELHQFFEEMGSFWECLANGKEPSRNTRSIDTMVAKGLCEQIIAPWLNLSHAEKTRLVEEAVETDPACAHVRVRAGVFFRDDPTRHDDALRHLRVAVMLDPDDSMAASLLALTLFEKDQLSEALEAIEPAASGKRATAMAIQIRGTLLLALERFSDAEECFNSVLEREPKNPNALHGRADVCRARGDRAGEARYRRQAEIHGGSRPIQAFPRVG